MARSGAMMPRSAQRREQAATGTARQRRVDAFRRVWSEARAARWPGISQPGGHHHQAAALSGSGLHPGVELEDASGRAGLSWPMRGSAKAVTTMIQRRLLAITARCRANSAHTSHRSSDSATRVVPSKRCASQQQYAEIVVQGAKPARSSTIQAARAHWRASCAASAHRAWRRRRIRRRIARREVFLGGKAARNAAVCCVPRVRRCVCRNEPRPPAPPDRAHQREAADVVSVPASRGQPVAHGERIISRRQASTASRHPQSMRLEIDTAHSAATKDGAAASASRARSRRRRRHAPSMCCSQASRCCACASSACAVHCRSPASSSIAAVRRRRASSCLAAHVQAAGLAPAPAGHQLLAIVLSTRWPPTRQVTRRQALRSAEPAPRRARPARCAGTAGRRGWRRRRRTGRQACPSRRSGVVRSAGCAPAAGLPREVARDAVFQRCDGCCR